VCVIKKVAKDHYSVSWASYPLRFDSEAADRLALEIREWPLRSRRGTRFGSHDPMGKFFNPPAAQGAETAAGGPASQASWQALSRALGLGS
jgi:hypothetical protein